MTMSLPLRRFALTAHVTFSVGWLGAVVCFLVLAAHGLISRDAQTVRGFYVAMSVIGWYVVVPFCLASLTTGVIQSLGTRWGLFLHYWVSAKFLITVASTLVLFGFTRTLNQMGALAADVTIPLDGLRDLSQSPILHSAGGLVLLLVNTALSVYKPWGRTGYGLRKQREYDEGASADGISPFRRRRRRFILLGAVGLFVLFVLLHLVIPSGH